MHNWLPSANVHNLSYFLLTTGTAISSQDHTPLTLSIDNSLFQYKVNISLGGNFKIEYILDLGSCKH